MNVFITDANIAHLAVSLSRSVCARTPVGKMHTPGSIAQAALTQRGTVPDPDLILAAVRRWAAVINDDGLQQLCDQLDQLLDSRLEKS